MVILTVGIAYKVYWWYLCTVEYISRHSDCIRW